MSPNLVGGRPSPSLEPRTEAGRWMSLLVLDKAGDRFTASQVWTAIRAIEAEATAPLLAAVTDVLREWDRRQSPDPGGWHGRALVKAVNRLRALLPAEPPEAPE